MESHFVDTSLTTPPLAPPQPELLLSAALHLMSHYSAQANASGACVKLAAVIERHLKALSGHADLAPVLRATCAQLSEHWAGVVEASLAKPARARARKFGWPMMGQH
jgi:hypothetical protein